MFLLCFVTMFASAQNTVQSARFTDNWAVAVQGGVQTNLHDWNAPQGAVTSVELVKTITPVFGLGFESQVGWNNLANWNHPYQTHVHNGNAVDAVSAAVNGRVNLMNWWGGYTGKPRVFETTAIASVGYGHAFFNSAYGSDTNHFLTKAGVECAFNLGKSKAWSINVTPAVVWNATIGRLDCRYAVGQLTAGVKYNFMTSNGRHHITKHVCPVPDPVIKETIKEVPIEKIKEIPIPKPTPSYVNSTYIVTFAKNSYDLSPEAVATLTRIANLQDVTVSIEAFASPEGRDEYNWTLSERRAEAVADFFHDREVTVESATGKGSTGDTSNRIAIITLK